MDARSIEPIAYIKTPYTDKFGIPRQSGMVESIISEIEFLPKYRNIDSIRGLSEFSHIWVLWEFVGFNKESWSPTVRPPRLGGNARMGVFATRSPNRPNSIGLSSLRLLSIDVESKRAPILKVSGADMLNGTAIYDIKPYIPFTDSHPNATSGFASEHIGHRLNVTFPESLCTKLNDLQISNIKEILSLDPRPSYQNDAERIYGMSLYDLNIKFKVDGNDLLVITVEQD